MLIDWPRNEYADYLVSVLGGGGYQLVMIVVAVVVVVTDCQTYCSIHVLRLFRLEASRLLSSEVAFIYRCPTQTSR